MNIKEEYLNKIIQGILPDINTNDIKKEDYPLYKKYYGFIFEEQTKKKK